MAALEYDPDFTRIFHLIKSEYVDPTDECTCGMYDCDCPRNPMMDVTMTTVEIHGRPVRFKPSDATFRIRVYKSVATLDRVDDHEFDEKDMETEFTVESTVDPVDLEGMYKDLLLAHCIDYDSCVPVYGHMFKGPQPSENYRLAFDAMVKNIAHPPKKREEAANAHIGRKQKKYKNPKKKRR